MLALAHKTIAITRPTGQAKKLTNLLIAAGAKTLNFPLIAIEDLDDYALAEGQLAQLDQHDWLIFISSNAVNHAMPRIQALYPQGLPPSLQFAAIGPTTAQTLTDYGVGKVLIPEKRFDSESLLSMPELQRIAGQKIMIIRGVGGRELLAKTLEKRGATVSYVECYRRINPQTSSAALYDHNAETVQCDAVVVTSSEAMRHLLTLVEINESNAATHWLRQIKLCVNLPRVAEAANNLGLSTYIAGKPGDQAMLNCLSNALKA